MRQSKLDKKALVTELNRSLTEEKLKEDVADEDKSVTIKVEEVTEIRVTKEVDVYEFNDVKPESESSSDDDDDDDDVPISSLTKKNAPVSEEAAFVPPPFKLDNEEKAVVEESSVEAKFVVLFFDEKFI